jgi:hypothetical protein
MVNPVGRPLAYKTADEMQIVIDKYFEECKGEELKDAAGESRLDKYGHPIIWNETPPTVTGLALALGFNSRQALLNYQGREDYNDTVMRAKARCERYAETRLFDRDGSNGAKFSLQNNFKSWSEKQELNVSHSFETLLSHLDDEE